MDNENVARIHNGILLSYKEKMELRNLQETSLARKQRTEWGDPGPERQMPRVLFHT